MILELAKKISKVDDTFGIKVEYYDNVICCSVVNSMLGEMYSYSATDPIEVYDKINFYIEALTDSDKYDELFNNISNKELEVTVG